MAAKVKIRRFPMAFKLKAIRRAEEGEGVLPVARKLGISRKITSRLDQGWKAHGPEGLNRKPGPKPGPVDFFRKARLRWPGSTQEDRLLFIAMWVAYLLPFQNGRPNWTE